MAEVETRIRTRHFVSRLRGETTRRASTCVSSLMALEVLQYGKADDVSKTYPQKNPQYEEKRASVKRSDSRRRSRSRDTIDCGRRPSRRLGRAGGCSRDASHHLPRRRARIVAVTDLHRPIVRSRRRSRIRGAARHETAAPWVVNCREGRVGVIENFVSAVVRSDARECSKRASGRRNTRISVSIGARG